MGKPCMWFHLADGCNFGDHCKYDHAEISAEVREYLRYAVKRSACSRGSGCRHKNCMAGHMCWSKKCLTEEVEDCPLLHYHGIDPKVASWVKVAEVESADDEGTAQATSMSEDEEDAPVESYWF
jgi:hypothetical protein